MLYLDCRAAPKRGRPEARASLRRGLEHRSTSTSAKENIVFLNVSKRRLSAALVAATLVAAMVPGLASASVGECEGPTSGEWINNAIHFAQQVNGTPMGGPTETWGWAHPDGKTANPGQAIQYFCFQR